MSAPDVSILIVHTFERRLIRQTLRGLRRAAPQLHVEVLVIDNNPDVGLLEMLKKEFPEVKYFPKRNEGFGSAMNVGMKHARGKYVLVFNPDIIISAGALEKLFYYMEANPQVGIVGPKLLNADGSLQYSCYRYPNPLVPVLRRTPLGRLPWALKILDRFLMKDVSHDQTIEVDWIMGSAMFTRAEALAKTGSFDERFFMYLEDTDLCWRFWEAGYKVVYYPEAVMVHYHRRASADGSIFQQLRSPLTWRHIQSAYKFFRKHSGQPNPREFPQLSSTSQSAG
ncbi:MAG: glycosyltransferase family 2 protein [Patescibacteria group bacterium]